MDAELQQLKDIHLPPPITMWPIAPGWIALFILALVAAGYLLYYWRQRARVKYTAKFALAQLKNMQRLIHDNPNNINIAAEISTLMRRTALYYFRRDEIAGLSGNAWLAFLNRSGNTTQFTTELGRMLTDAPYQKNSAADLTPLFDLTQSWLMRIAKPSSKPKES